MADTLFGPVDVPEPPEKLTGDRRRTQRQLEMLTGGQHPLAAALNLHMPLHVEAASLDQRDGPGRRCGNCWYRRPVHWHGKWYPKCHYTTQSPEQFETAPERMTHGTGTDVRRWWPACADHVWGAPEVSVDAARCVPGGAL